MMNKNIKKIIALVLAIGTVAALAPATNVNLLNTNAYAADDNDEDYLDSLNLYDENGDSIKLYSDADYSDKVDDDDIEEGEIYYTKTSSNTVSIDIEGPSDKYVKVFNGSSSSSKGKDVGDDIDISDDSTTTLIIKVYGEEPDDDIRYGDNDDYNVLSTYRVKVEYTGDNESSDNIYLERLSVNNNMLDLSKSKDSYTYNVDSDVKEVTIRATPEDDDYDATINGKRVHSSDNYKETVDLDKGTNEFEIEIEDGDVNRVYTLVINRGNPSSTSTSTTNTMNAEDYDNIYLNKLSIDGKLISLSKSNINYTSSVSKDIDKVTIKAEPEKDYHTVTINDEEVYEDEDYKSTVHLNNGENAIKINLKNENSGEERVYILNVTRGSAASTSATASTQNTVDDNVNATKTNQWVQVNGVWQYNDASGNPVKNTWVQNYYLLDSGNMATGWLNYSGSWYYLGSDGAKKTGWQLIDGNWYHLDSQGKIQTGWFKDLDGKYYYLNGYGAMVYNTTIDGYKIGTDGVWTGK